MLPDIILTFLEGEIFGSLTLMILFVVVGMLILFNKKGLGLGVSTAFILAVLYAGWNEGKIESWVFYSSLLVIAFVWIYILNEYKK